MPVYGGVTDAGREDYGHSLVTWETMLYGIRAGLDSRRPGFALAWIRAGLGLYDIGRSTPGTSAAAFKEHWRPRTAPPHVPLRLAAGSIPPHLDANRPHFRVIRAI